MELMIVISIALSILAIVMAACAGSDKSSHAQNELDHKDIHYQARERFSKVEAQVDKIRERMPYAEGDVASKGDIRDLKDFVYEVHRQVEELKGKKDG